MQKLKDMIEERRQLLKEHESGERRLEAADFERASRQLENFQRKLKQMEERNTRVSFFHLIMIPGVARNCFWCFVFVRVSLIRLSVDDAGTPHPAR
jgi:hypothetical protein